jgi:hypothetical protein
MTMTTEDLWAQPFAPEDLEAAFTFAADHKLPVSLANTHEGADEVLEVPPRDGMGSGLVQFAIYRPTSGPQYVVAENDRERAMGFHSLISALRFCVTQRGSEWPEDGFEDDRTEP